MSIRIDGIVFENSPCYRLPPAATAELLNCGFAFCEWVVALVGFYRGLGNGSLLPLLPRSLSRLFFISVCKGSIVIRLRSYATAAKS